jgi:hypothetical protein
MSYAQNVWQYFKPSASYTKHRLVDHIQWKPLYNSFFAFPIFNVLLFLAGILYLAALSRHDYARTIGLVLPGMYIFLVSVLFEKGENMRFKFFLEPVLFIFVVSQLYTVGLSVYKRVTPRRGYHSQGEVANSRGSA